MEQTLTFEFDYVADEMAVEKDAKIFEAGEYPDKEITVTEADLDGIIESFTEVPVKVEHTDSPLDPLGTVKRIWRRGKDLFARLAFPSDLAGFLERRGIKKLSVALHKDPLRLAEVSLVLSPRVPSAAMFGQTGEHGNAEGKEEAERRQENVTALVRIDDPSSEHSAESADLREIRVLSNPQSEIRNPQCGEVVICEMADQDKDARIRELQFALRAKDVEAKLGELKAQGKVVPAAEAYAREILLQGDGKVTFGEGEATVAQLFECFLDAQPKVITFGELAPSVIGSASPLTAEEEELMAKLGVTREQMQKYEG